MTPAYFIIPAATMIGCLGALIMPITTFWGIAIAALAVGVLFFMVAICWMAL